MTIAQHLSQHGVNTISIEDGLGLVNGSELSSHNSLSSQPVSTTTPPSEGAPALSRRSAPQWPEPLGEAAYYGLAGKTVRAIEPHTEASPVALLVQFLAAFGNAIGRHAYFAAEADKHYTNLFGVLVGRSSKGRKGTSWGQTRRLLGSVDESWRQATGLSSGEGLIWAVRDKIEKTEPIKEKGKITGYQVVIVDPGVTDKRLLVVEPEFALVLKVISRDSNTLSAIIRQAWDSGNLSTLTKNSPAKATDAHISIIGHVTKDELRRYLEDTETANGFANRFLWICSERAQVLPEGGNLSSVDFGSILKKLNEAVEFGQKDTEVKRDSEARQLWFEVYEELSEGKPGLFGAVTGRAEAQVMRLAMIYALLDCSAIIKQCHLEAALELWRYCEDSARYIFGDAVGDPVADVILSALEEAGDAGMSRTEIHKLLQRHASANRLNTALDALAGAGRVIGHKEPTDGRPVEKWLICSPAAKKAKKAKKALPVESESQCERSERSEISPEADDLSSLNSLLSHRPTEKSEEREVIEF